MTRHWTSYIRCCCVKGKTQITMHKTWKQSCNLSSQRCAKNV